MDKGGWWTTWGRKESDVTERLNVRSHQLHYPTLFSRISISVKLVAIKSFCITQTDTPIRSFIYYSIMDYISIEHLYLALDYRLRSRYIKHLIITLAWALQNAYAKVGPAVHEEVACEEERTEPE